MATKISTSITTQQSEPVQVRGLKEPKPELRVLQIFSVLGMGGAETWLMTLLRYFHQQQDLLPFRVKFDILLTGARKEVFDDEATALGATLFYVPFTRGGVISFAREFRKILSEGHYDVIHDHQDYIAGLHFLLGAGKLPSRRIAHVHNSITRKDNYAKDVVRQFSSSTGKRLLHHFATDILGTSKQVLGEYGFTAPVFPNVRLRELYCGFDVTAFVGDGGQARAEILEELKLTQGRIILFVGRLDYPDDPKLNEKNPMFALQVAAECRARDQNVHLLMAGKASQETQNSLNHRIREWGLEDNVHLLGIRSDVPRLMLGSDLLILPSHAEGLGMVVVEAQAAGLRALASDTIPRECVVVPDLVQFLPLSKGPDFWATESLRLCTLPRLDATDSAMAVIESSFSIDKSAANLLTVYGSPQNIG